MCLPLNPICRFSNSQVEALAVQLTQREGELIQEKAEVKRLATFLKQVKKKKFLSRRNYLVSPIDYNDYIFWGFNLI